MKRPFSRRTIPAVLAALCCTTAANAGIIFDDDFNGENAGLGTLNYGSFSNFSVTGGTVDLIGNGFYDFLPGQGLFVDLDGSTGDAGLFSTGDFALTPGTYSVSFSLAGNHRGGSDDVTVSFGDWSQTYNLLANDPLTSRSVDVVITQPQTTRLTFQNAGGDNIGALLDDVRISSVPSPAGVSMMGLLGAALILRRGR